MKKLLILATLSVLTIAGSGCNTAKPYDNRPIVRNFVDSIGSESISVNRNRPLNFLLPKDADLKVKKVIKLCAKGAREMGVRAQVNQASCKNCLHVVVGGKRTGQSERIKSDDDIYPMWGFGSGLTLAQGQRTKSVAKHHREVNIAIYADRELKQMAHQIAVRSSGYKSSVLSVIETMCVAGFKNYPEEFEDRRITAKLR